MDQKTTKSPHPPVNLRIKFRSDSLPQFIERYATDVSRGGIFIRTREPLGVGTQLKLDFQYQGGTPLMSGDGTVVWVREFDPSRANVPPGMGVRFDKLAPESLGVLEQILVAKAEREGGTAGATSGSPNRPASPESVPGGGRRPGLGGSSQTVAPPAPATPIAAPRAAAVAPPAPAAGTDPSSAGGGAAAAASAPPVAPVTPVSDPAPASPRATAAPIFPESPSFVDSDELDEEPTQIAAGLPSLMGGGPELEDTASASAPRLPGMATSRPAGFDAPPSPAGGRSPSQAPDQAPGQAPGPVPMGAGTAAPAAQVFTSALRGGPTREPSSAAVPSVMNLPEPSGESTTESTVPGLAELGATRGSNGEVAPRATDDDSSSNFSAATTTTPLDPADLVEQTASSTPGPDGPVPIAPVSEPRGVTAAGEPTQSLSLEGLHSGTPPEPRAPSGIALQTVPKAISAPGDAKVGGVGGGGAGAGGSGAGSAAPGMLRDRGAEVPGPPSAARARERRLPAPLILVTVLALAASGFFLVRFFKSQATDLLPGTDPGHTAMESPGAPPPTLQAAEPAATTPPAPGPAGAASAEPAAAGPPAAQGTVDAGAAATATATTPAPSPPATAAAAAAAAAAQPTEGNDAQAGAKVALPPTEATPAPEAAKPGPAPDTGKAEPKPEMSRPKESKADKAPAPPRRKPLRLARASGPGGTAAASSGDGDSETTGGATNKGGGGPIYELKITSKPPGGDVSIDGQVVGKTPFTGNLGDLGSPHFVTIRRDGFELFEQMVGTTSAWVKVKTGKAGTGSSVQQLKLNVKLRPLAGTPVAVEPPPETGDRPAGELAPKSDSKADKADDNTLPPTDLVAPGGAPQ